MTDCKWHLISLLRRGGMTSMGALLALIDMITEDKKSKKNKGDSSRVKITLKINL